jgi:hypothetical protein
MKIILNNLPSVEDCKIYVDFGKGYEEFNLSEVKNTGIKIPEDCIDISKIRFKSDSSLIKSSALYDSLYIADECIDLEPNFEKSTVFPDCCFADGYTLPDGVTSINDYAFRYCEGLTSIDIPNSVTSIGERVFFYCSNLTIINISSSITKIGNFAFSYCSKLKSINIPNSVTSIGNNAFQNCSSLTSIDIPKGVTSIGYRTFENCSSLTSIDIPKGVTSIGYRTFYMCINLRTINYTGNEEQWNTITKGTEWNYQVPSDCQIVFNYIKG